MGCRPVAAVIMHVHKYEIRIYIYIYIYGCVTESLFLKEQTVFSKQS